MAIEKYTFSGSGIASQAEEVLAWIQANTTEYFSTVSADENGNISCYIGEKLCVKFGLDTSTYRCSLYNHDDEQYPQDKSYSTASAKVFKYAIKTSKGFMISWLNYSSNAVQDSVWFTKTDRGTTGIVALFQEQSTANTSGRFLAAEFEANEWYRTWITADMNGSTWNDWFRCSNDYYTSLNPIYCAYTENSTPVYCPDLYVGKFSQAFSKWSASKLTLNGKDYFTNGILYLSA